MSGRKRTPSAAEGRRDDWLGRTPQERGRGWALEEQLFGATSAKTRDRALAVLRADLATERAGLARLEEELHEQAVRVARLEWRMRVLAGPEAKGPVPENGPTAPRQPLVSRPSRSSLERDYWLCRCEGFWVDSPSGRIGLVDGLRFLSRIDQPDLLEVRAGFLGRQLLLIPSRDVDEIRSEEGRLVLRDVPRYHNDHLADLVARLRRRRPATV